jgi:hypothetical protein
MTYIIVMLLYVVGAHCEERTPMTTLQEIRNGVELGERLVASFTGGMTITTDAIETVEAYIEDQLHVYLPVDMEQRFIVASHGSRWRCDYTFLPVLEDKMDTYESLYIRACDGETQQRYDVARPYPDGIFFNPHGQIRAPEEFKRSLSPRPFINIIGDKNRTNEYYPVSDILGDCTEEDVKITYAVIDDISCLHISDNVHEENNTIDLWIAPQYNYQPIRASAVSDSIKIISDYSYNEYQDGVWFVEEIKRRVYYRDAQKQSDIHYLTKSLVVDDEFTVNCEIPSELFSLSFPRGLMISNSITGEQYIQE